MELRLCSIALSEAWPLDRVPRDKDVTWYRRRFGLTFGRALYGALSGTRPFEPAQVLMAHSGVEFANADQIAWAVHVAGMAAVVQRIPSDSAHTISQFAAGLPPFSAVPSALKNLGVFSVVSGSQARQLRQWLLAIDTTVLAEEARDLHGAEWVSSILSVVSTIGTVFGSTHTHGCDICVWGSP